MPTTAAQGQQAAERMLNKARVEHKADIETRDSKYAALQAQVGTKLLLCVAYRYVLWCIISHVPFFLPENNTQQFSQTCRPKALQITMSRCKGWSINILLSLLQFLSKGHKHIWI